MKTREFLTLKARTSLVNARYKQEIPRLRDALTSTGMKEVDGARPSLDHIRATLDPK